MRGPVELWTSPADRREPYGPCGQPLDNADALPTACPHSRASRPQSHRTNERLFKGTTGQPLCYKTGQFYLLPTAVSVGLARLLRILSDPARAHESGELDTSTTARVLVAPVEQRPQTLPGTAPPRSLNVPGGHRRRLADGVLAHGQTCGAPAGPSQPLFRLARSPPTLHPCQGLIRVNRRGT